MARAGRDEYEAFRDQIREADVVHVDETGLSLEGMLIAGDELPSSYG